MAVNFFRELREAIWEIQHVLNDEAEMFPLTVANMLCEALIELGNEHEHETQSERGTWADWRGFAYGELGREESMPSRNRIHLSRKQRRNTL